MSYSKFILSKKNLLYNFNALKASKVCAVVKANAYNHNVKFVCQTLKNKVEYFGVASLCEALEIRQFNSENKVLILGKCSNVFCAIKNNISFIIESVEDFENLLKIVKKNLFFLKKSYKIANFHVKIDSGMNRLGIKKLCDFELILKKYLNFEHKKYINFEGIFTHFAAVQDKVFLQKQVQKFKAFIAKIPALFQPVIHVGGSGANCVLKHFDNAMLRVGIGLFLPRQVMFVESTVIKVSSITFGERVGYSNGYICAKKQKIALVPLGYADGLDRKLSGKAYVKINGKKYRIVGNICMDMFFVLVDETVKVGDAVLVFTSAREWAKITNTIEYEIFTRINSKRMQKEIY